MRMYGASLEIPRWPVDIDELTRTSRIESRLGLNRGFNQILREGIKRCDAFRLLVDNEMNL